MALAPAAVEQASPRRRPFPWLRFSVLCVATVGILGMAAEIVLRIGELRGSSLVELQCAGAGTLLQGQKGLFQLDSVSGFAMRPNVCVRLRSVEYDQVLRTNSRGFVGPEVPASKPPGEFRVAVLGDSYTAGGQVPYAQNYAALLQDELRADGYSRVRVINLGIGGCGTFCQAGVLEENIGWAQPDLVVVSVFVGNNVSENVLAVAGGYRDAPEHPKGVTWGPAAGELVDESGAWFARNGLPSETAPAQWNPAQPLPTPVANAPRGTPPYAPPAGVASPLSVVRLAARDAWEGARRHSRVLATLFGEPVDSSVTTAPGAAPPSSELKRLNLTSFEWLILRDQPRAYWLDVAWPLFDHYLTQIQQTAANSGARVVLMVIPQMGQFDDAMRARTMADFRFHDDEVEWERPQRMVHEQTAKLGLAVLDLLPIFRLRADRADLYLREDTHFSALGHRVVAEELANYLQQNGWLYEH